MTITYGSLFSGIGGFDFGFDRAGMSCRWQCEIDAHARRVLAHHWPAVPCHDDIRTLDGGRLEPVDVICGGFPCQDLSVAGNRAGLAGARSGLYHEMIRVIREMRDATRGTSPAVVVFENVPGLLSSHGGRDLAVVLGELADSGALDIGWRVLDAQWFGVAQRRRRVFVVGDFGGARAGAILALADSLRGHPAPRRTPRQGPAAGTEGGAGNRRGFVPAVSGTLGTNATGGDRQDLDSGGASIAIQDAAMPRDKQQHGIGVAVDAPMYTLDSHGAHAVAFDLAQVTSRTNRSNPQPGDPCNVWHGSPGQSVVAFSNRGTDTGVTAETLRSDAHGSMPMVLTIAGDVTHALTHEGHDASEDGTGRGTPIIAFALRGRDEGNVPEVSDDVSPAICGASGGSTHTHVAVSAPECADSLTVGANQTTGVVGEVVSHDMTVRRLTPRECERLQGFPDDWTLLNPPQSDSARYRQCGNAVAVPVAAWLGQRIVTALEVT